MFTRIYYYILRFNAYHALQLATPPQLRYAGAVLIFPTPLQNIESNFFNRKRNMVIRIRAAKSNFSFNRFPPKIRITNHCINIGQQPRKCRNTDPFRSFIPFYIKGLAFCMPCNAGSFYTFYRNFKSLERRRGYFPNQRLGIPYRRIIRKFRCTSIVYCCLANCAFY